MAVFNPVPLSPVSGEGRDSTQTIRFSWDFISDNNETQTSYRVTIYNVTDTSTIVHDSGTVTSALEYYDLTASTLANGNDYVWRVTIVSDTETRTNRSFAHFKTLATPTLTVDSIGSVGQFKTFTATYSQAQSVPVKTFQWTLYDNSDVVLETAQLRFGEDIEETFTGFDNNTTYKIDVTAINQDNVTITSPRVSFTATFTIPENSPEINVNARPDLTSIEVDYSNIINLTGQVIGSFSYVDGKFNKSLRLNNACFQANLENNLIPQRYTISFWIKLDTAHDGDFFTLKKDDVVVYRVGYDRARRRFYYQRGYRTVYGTEVYELPSNYLLIGCTSNSIHVRTLWQSTVERMTSIKQGLTIAELYRDRTTVLRDLQVDDLINQPILNYALTYKSVTDLINNNFRMSIQ